MPDEGEMFDANHNNISRCSMLPKLGYSTREAKLTKDGRSKLSNRRMDEVSLESKRRMDEVRLESKQRMD